MLEVLFLFFLIFIVIVIHFILDAFIAKFKAAQVAQQKLLQLLDERRTSPEDVLKALCGKRSFMFTFEQV